jgi:hypothetical protein
MCSCHLLKFLNNHVGHKEGREMTVNLQSGRVKCKNIDINYNKNNTKVKANKFEKLAKNAPHQRILRRYPCEQRRCTF